MAVNRSYRFFISARLAPRAGGRDAFSDNPRSAGRDGGNGADATDVDGDREKDAVFGAGAFGAAALRGADCYFVGDGVGVERRRQNMEKLRRWCPLGSRRRRKGD